jgi:deoxyadenosine/deoxycytidine kinase
MAVELKERLDQKARIIAVLGGTGVGKTTFTDKLSSELGIPIIPENYSENPFLKPFYEVDYAKYSFQSQLNFLLNGADQLTFSGEIPKSGCLLDAGNEMNLLYAQTHLEMGWMKSEEYEMYKALYDIFHEKSEIRKPDFFVCLHAELPVIVGRIKKRNRHFELKMLNEHPSYFLKLNIRVVDFALSHPGNSILVDANNNDFICGEKMNGVIKGINEKI